MKNRISKIMGIAVTLAMVLSLTAGFAAAPAAASPDETINEWYKFDYPKEGEDGDWFYDPTIGSVGPVAEAINGDLYTAVSFGQEARFDVSDDTGTMSIMPIYDGHTGIITAIIEGNYSSGDDELRSGYFCARWCFHSEFIEGWEGSVYACGVIADVDVGPDMLMFSGYIVGDFETGGPWPVTSGSFNMYANGKLEGMFDFSEAQALETEFCGSYELGSSLMKSTDGGRTWDKTGYEDVEVDLDPIDTYIVPPGPVVDMVCSSIDEDVIYVTDGRYVYKSDDGGDTFDFVAKDSLETELVGECGCPIIFGCPISSIDVSYDEDDNPFVFIGTREHVGDLDPGCDYTDWMIDWMPGDVYYIAEGGFPANWTSLNLDCFRGGGYEALAVGCAPDWAETKETYVVVSGTGFRTFVVYTKGTVCGWYEFAELEWDCERSFGSYAASRIGFPDDWEDSETLFVGIVDEFPCVSGAWDPYPPIDEQGGDVYMATDGSAVDLNVAGIITGCQGEESVDIISLDVMGDTDEAQLIAGAFCTTDVYYSTDGGWSWDVSEKNPTGSWETYVIWYEDTALAATTCCNAAFSMSCGEEVGQYWNQISLISTEIDCVNYIDHSPGYLSADSETMFMITKDCEACLVCDCEGPPYMTDTLSLFRHDGTYWERVFLNITAEEPQRTEWQVHVSPDFLTTNCVYLGNEYFEMWRSTDAGCSWDQLTFPCAPRPCISAWEVIDEDTVIAGGACFGSPCDCANGYVYKTTRHGARPWDEYEVDTTGNAVSFALEPGYEDPGSILLGDNNGQVFISEDGGETWDLVGKAIVGSVMYYPVWVIFDPGYATNHIIYAATGKVIARCIIDPDEDWADQEWEQICSGLDEADGIQAAGDTALYVTDNYPVTGGVDCGVFRSLNPDAEDADDVVFEELATGLDDRTELRNLWLTTDVSDEGCTENVLWSLEWDQEACPYCEYAGPDIWVYEDTLAQPVVLNTPVEGQKVGTTGKATLSWKELCGADCYEVSLYSYCPECPDQKLEIPLCLDCAPVDDVVCGPEVECTRIAEHDTLGVDPVDLEGWCCPCTEETCITVDGLDPGTTYYWQVRVCQGNPHLSKWSEERTFITALPVVDFSLLCSPDCGGQNVIITPNFSWHPVEEATGYEVELAPTETFTAGVIKGKTTVNAWSCTTTLDYATTYYWRVRAEKDSIYSDWSTCLFTTMEKPVPPTPPVEVVTPPAAPAPVVQIPAAEMITPTWIYAMIGVGGALAIVVIVLIVRTRRPPA